MIKSHHVSSITRTLIAMVPLSVLYTYVSTPNAITTAGTPDSPIVIIENSVAFSSYIPKNYANRGFEDFVVYLSACPLRYALADIPDSFLPQHVCDFYFTSTFIDAGVIIGTINDGNHI
ncbi:unnamed protein product [Lactuca virosa]|uniref:Uncharacterized protein n=1 Tax=Lactuca virosa TaxID=75947 RepID=A0AAU9PBR5_9ASTR|nr:unnamed protein product [Lactuca virosa]